VPTPSTGVQAPANTGTSGTATLHTPVHEPSTPASLTDLPYSAQITAKLLEARDRGKARDAEQAAAGTLPADPTATPARPEPAKRIKISPEQRAAAKAEAKAAA